MKRAKLRETATSAIPAAPTNPRDGVWMLPGFANTGVVETEEGAVLIDVPGVRWITGMIKMLRERIQAPVHTIFFTHGHLDHALSLEPVLEDARKRGHPRPRSVAQRNLVKRFNRYRMLDRYHDHINRVQFAVPEGTPAFQPPPHNPDVTFDQTISLRVGGLDFHAFHAMGETDDALWVWVPEKKTVFAGDLIVVGMPNVGNPFKVQRYALEWAEGLEAILAKDPEIVIPGHGFPLEGKATIRKHLGTICRALRYLHDEVVRRLNDGMWYEDILHEVDLPESLKNEEALAPLYGCPKFVVHGILRQYTGWYDGNPSNLFPPKRVEIHREIVSMTGKEAVMQRARALKEEGRAAMAVQFVDIALAADLSPEEERSLHQLKAELLGMLGDAEPSFIARNIYYNGHNVEMKRAGLEP